MPSAQSWSVQYPNARPIAIFSNYMLTAALLTWASIRIIVRQRQRRGSEPLEARIRHRVVWFTLLAIGSLCTTWYHMFAFFAHSYRAWAAAHGVGAAGSALQLGPWLRDTQLFKLAWASAMETDSRFWWTQQIFGWASWWTVLLSTERFRRQLSGTWIFMLLAQIVAVSFASNLSFLALLLSPGDRKKSAPATRASGPLLLVVVLVSAICVMALAAEPNNNDHPLFLAVLLLPHIILFVPLLLPMGPATPAPNSKSSVGYWLLSANGITAIVRILAVMAQAQTMLRMFKNGGSVGGIMSALHEHPAVSSVGWDVIWCWLSYSVWHISRSDEL